MFQTTNQNCNSPTWDGGHLGRVSQVKCDRDRRFVHPKGLHVVETSKEDEWTQAPALSHLGATMSYTTLKVASKFVDILRSWGKIPVSMGKMEGLGFLLNTYMSNVQNPGIP